ncbi:MAG: hypothetical protein O3C29_01290 [Proteobacteria bacterium]|jgi:hypothetical protein|nr:hypothetical protein [Pseudomonadota bacterium]MDA1289263.1 hypothetical protein [Pseudomonadota bacterium]
MTDRTLKLARSIPHCHDIGAPAAHFEAIVDLYLENAPMNEIVLDIFTDYI